MPIYEFLCRECSCEQELLVRSEEAPICESCGSERLQKLLSVPAAHGGKTSGNEEPGPCGGGCGCFPS